MADFSFPDELLDHDHQGVIGNGATIHVGTGCVMKGFRGNIQGHGNFVHIAANVRLSSLQLNIEGNDNCISILPGTHVENTILNVRADTRVGNFRGNNNVLRIGPSSRLQDMLIEVKGSHNSLTLGAKIYVLESAKFLLHGYGCSISIGELTSIQSAIISASEIDTSISIGRDNMYAGMVVMATGDSHPVLDATTLHRINQAGNITVGDHVWLAGSVRLMKGAAIGDNCVVGFDSFVSRPMTDESGMLAKNALIYGSPAKVRVKDIAWNREMIWDRDAEKGIAHKYPDACAQSQCHRGHYLVNRANQLALADATEEALADYSESIKAYQEAVRLKPDYAYAYSALGVALLHLSQIHLECCAGEAAMEDISAAVLNLNQALTHDPKHEDSAACLVLSQELLDVVRSSLSNSASQPDMFYPVALGSKQLGLIRLRLGDLEVARNLLRRSRDLFARAPGSTVHDNHRSDINAALDSPELRPLAADRCR